MKNKYEIISDIVYIYLHRRKDDDLITKIDLEDLERVKSYNVSWYANWDEKLESYYCKGTEYLGTINGKPKYKIHRLHRVITNALKGTYVDHLNHDTLDNRKCNLDATTSRINTQNRNGANKNTSTGYRNVSWSNKDGKYLVQIQVNGKNTIMGKFDDLNQAVICAEEGRKIYYTR